MIQLTGKKAISTNRAEKSCHAFMHQPYLLKKRDDNIENQKLQFTNIIHAKK